MPEITPNMEDTMRPPFLPILSANSEPLNEPILPPIRNIETAEDHKMSSCVTVKELLNLVIMLSLQNFLITYINTK